MPLNETAEDAAIRALFDATIATDTVALDLAKKVGEDIFKGIMKATETAEMASPLPRSILALMMSTAALHAASTAHAEVLMSACGVGPDEAGMNLHMLMDKCVAKLKEKAS